jgi:site-specific DNA recombinase
MSPTTIKYYYAANINGSKFFNFYTNIHSYKEMITVKAAIYARYSSDNQREESIDAQVRAIKEYCTHNNIQIVKLYTDEAKTATTDDRPGFLQMVKDSELGIFNLVIVHKLDRFARDRYDSAFYKRQLKRNGVRLISVLEQLDDSPESIILESVLEGMAEYYSANLAREVMKGMKETALQCKHTGGKPPLGYDVAEDKTYIINEQEAQAVRLIFNMYATGKGYNEIIDKLNKEGYRTQTGRKFGKNSIHDILRNEKYRGIYIFNRDTNLLDALFTNWYQ